MRLKHIIKLDQMAKDIASVEKSNNNGVEQLRFNDRISKAGYLFESEKSKLFKKYYAGCLLVLIIVLLITLSYNQTLTMIIAYQVITLLALATLFHTYLSIKIIYTERDILFETPILLEAIIQLVESGIGLLPAIDEVVNIESKKQNTVRRILKYIYEQSANNMTLSQALTNSADSIDNKTLKHILLHLDISGNEGGALAPSLKSLSDHSYLSWKLSVETRVKKLENLVIFPVFLAVIGLLTLTAAAPLKPVIDFMNVNNSESNALFIR